MAISDKINSIKDHLDDDWKSVEALNGITEYDKNIENIASALEDIYDDLPKVTGEGTSVSLNNTKVGKLSSTLKGNTSQTGTPTPSSPIPVNVVSGDNSVVVCGKNLFNPALLSQETSYNTYNSSTQLWTTNNGGGYVRSLLYNVYGGGNRDISKLIKLEPNTTYVLSFFDFSRTTTDNNYLNLAFYDTSGVLIGSGIDTKGNPTFTTPNQECYLDIRRSNNSGTFTFSNIQIELGNSASAYEPHTEETYPINLPEGMELCKIGDYQDYFYKDSGNWYLHKEIGKVVLDGSEDGWAYSSTNTNFNIRSYYLGMKSATTSTGYIPKVCNYFKYYAISGNTPNLADGIYENTNNTQISFLLFHCNSLNITTLQDWYTWLNTNKPIIYYLLETTTNTEITYQPLIDQLNAIENAMSKQGQTNISQVNNDLPFYLDVSALLDVSTYISQLEAQIEVLS